MIEKFNFYDVYGYFVPGAAFVAILWIPIGLVRHRWPSSSWSGAIVAAVLAYIVGHLVQSLATNAIPSWGSKGRYPSDSYLDASDKELPEATKTKIQSLVKEQFGLELKVERDGDESLDRVRRNAFFLARQILIQGKSVSYAEQLQGMYAVSRGLVSVLSLAFAYWLGFAFAAAVRAEVWMKWAIVGLAAATLVLANLSLLQIRIRPSAATKQRIELFYATTLLIAFFLVGNLLGHHCEIKSRDAAVLLFGSACALVGALRAYGAYKGFAAQFAASVWRDYLAYNAAAALHPKPEHGS